MIELILFEEPHIIGFLLDGKIDDAVSRIHDSDDKIRQFVKDSGDALVWSTYANYLMARLANLVKLKEESSALLIAEQEKLDELKTRLADEPEWVEYSKTYSKDTLWEKGRTDLLDLRRMLASKLSKYGKNNFEVKVLEAQVEAVE